MALEQRKRAEAIANKTAKAGAAQEEEGSIVDIADTDDEEDDEDNDAVNTGGGARGPRHGEHDGDDSASGGGPTGGVFPSGVPLPISAH